MAWFPCNLNSNLGGKLVWNRTHYYAELSEHTIINNYNAFIDNDIIDYTAGKLTFKKRGTVTICIGFSNCQSSAITFNLKGYKNNVHVSDLSRSKAISGYNLATFEPITIDVNANDYLNFTLYTPEGGGLSVVSLQLFFNY